MILVFRAQFFLSSEKYFYKTKDRSMSRLDAWPAADIWEDKTNCRIIADKARQSSHTFWTIGKQNVRNIAGKMSGDLMAYFTCLSPVLQLSSWHWKAFGRHRHCGHRGQWACTSMPHPDACDSRFWPGKWHLFPSDLANDDQYLIVSNWSTCNRNYVGPQVSSLNCQDAMHYMWAFDALKLPLYYCARVTILTGT